MFKLFVFNNNLFEIHHNFNVVSDVLVTGHFTSLYPDI